MHGEIILRLDLVDQDCDLGRLEQHTNKLSRDLRSLRVGDVGRIIEDVPESSKAGEAVTAGALLVTLASSTVLKSLVDVFSQWISRGERRSVKITLGEDSIELSGATKEEREKLVAEWIERRSTEITR